MTKSKPSKSSTDAEKQAGSPAPSGKAKAKPDLKKFRQCVEAGQFVGVLPGLSIDESREVGQQVYTALVNDGQKEYGYYRTAARKGFPHAVAAGKHYRNAKNVADKIGLVWTTLCELQHEADKVNSPSIQWIRKLIKFAEGWAQGERILNP